MSEPWDVRAAVNTARAAAGQPPLPAHTCDHTCPRPPLRDVDDSALDHDEQGRPTSNAAIGWRGRMRNR